MRKQIFYQYYVEGEDERSLVNALKTGLRCIEPGKVEKFNAVQNPFPFSMIRLLKYNTIVILIYDTDVEYCDILRQNIAFLKKQKNIRDVLCIPQVRNLEEELKYACNIKNIRELTHSDTEKDYKRDIISCSNLSARLLRCGFEKTKLWSRMPGNRFLEFGNDAAKIKK